MNELVWRIPKKKKKKRVIKLKRFLSCVVVLAKDP